jgi:hypothetical protein
MAMMSGRKGESTVEELLLVAVMLPLSFGLLWMLWRYMIVSWELMKWTGRSPLY